MRVVEGPGIDRRDRRVHAPQPGVAFDRADLERVVTHPQSRVAALVRIGVRSAPVLLEEHPHPAFGRTQIFLGIEGPDDVVLGDFLVEARGELAERLRSAHRLIEGLLHVSHGVFHCARAGGNGLRHRLFTECPAFLSEMGVRRQAIHGALGGNLPEVA